MRKKTSPASPQLRNITTQIMCTRHNCRNADGLKFIGFYGEEFFHPKMSSGGDDPNTIICVEPCEITRAIDMRGAGDPEVYCERVSAWSQGRDETKGHGSG